MARLSAATIARLDEQVADDDAITATAGDEERAAVGGGPGLLAELKADPGRRGPETPLSEIAKLERVRALGLADDLFAESVREAAAGVEGAGGCGDPARMRLDPPAAVRSTLLAALCACRPSKITDRLVELLLGVVHRVDARAENRRLDLDRGPAAKHT